MTQTTSVLSMPSHKVLRNRGIPVKVHKVEPTPTGGWIRTYEGPDDDPVTETVYVRMTAAVLADIEEAFESIDGWQKALTTKPFTSLVTTMALIWEVPRDQAGKMMIDEGTGGYSTAVGGAYTMANGGSPDAVVRVLEVGAKTSTTRDEVMDLATNQAVDEEEKNLAEVAVAVRAAVDALSETRSHPDGPSGDLPEANPGTTTTVELRGAVGDIPGEAGSSSGIELVEPAMSSGT